MEGFNNTESTLSTHIEKIERGQVDVINEFRVRGMFNNKGGMLGTIATKKATEELVLSGRQDRDR